MKKMTVQADDERFRTGAEKYAAYLATPEGRLRSDLTFANLKEYLPPAAPSLRALDLGCGTGAIALRLARLGIHVTLLDSSLQMLDLAKRAAQKDGVTDKVEVLHTDVTQLANLSHLGLYDLILCHNLLEYVDDPSAVLRGVARALRDSSAIASVLVRNQAGEVLKAAIQAGDLVAAESNLTAKWGRESLYEGNVRLFAAESLRTMLLESSLAVTVERGVRVLSDYLPPQVSRNDEYEAIFHLERKLGMRSDFVPIARYTHCVAHRAAPVIRNQP